MKLIIVAAALCVLAPAVHGQVLLSDDFDRGNALTPLALDGTSPTYAASPESWTADSSITTNGSSAYVPGTSTVAPDYGVTAYIGIPGVTGGNLTIGQTYTLQFTMTQASGGGAWTAAGFGTETNTQDDPIANGNDSGFFCIDNGSGISIYYDTSPGINNNIYYTGDNPGTNVVDLTITMGATTDTLSASINGTPLVLTTSVVPPVDPMTEVFIGDAVNTNGAFSDLSVFEGVPEPSTYALLFGGLGMLVLLARLRHKLAA